MLNLRLLNPQQREAVETIDGPVLILAGAGTGKTRVITYRIARMIERGIPAERVLAVTFTNKAAREMKQRAMKLVPASVRKSKEGGAAGPTICTFHSLCVRILRQHIEKLGYKRNFIIYDESDQIGTVKKLLARISARGEKQDPAAILAFLSRFKNAEQGAMLSGDESVLAMANHIRKQYDAALHSCNAVDFDDLILLALRLFREHPEALEACRARFGYVMVDEYQDTNRAQFNLVHALTSGHGNICVVGDDDQSIYGWRGAEITNLLEMEKYFPRVKIINLEQNYRSTSTILNAANAVIRKNVRRRVKTLWSQLGEGGKIVLNAYSDDEEEARSVVEQIEYERLAHRLPWETQAILFRTNIQSRPLETALRQVGVRYHLIGGQSFFDRREVRDLLAYLKAILNPNDDASVLRIANTPPRGLSETTMERLLAASHERKGSVFSAMKNPTITATFPAKARTAVEEFVRLLEGARRKLENPDDAFHRPGSGALKLWAEQLLDAIGYYDEVRRWEKTAEAAENRIRNVRGMLTTLDGAGAALQSPLERLREFLDEVSLDNEKEEEREESGNAVTLITMHSCKGLEFPNVFIVGMEEGLLPHSRSTDGNSLDEERRLFYVAITRAMRKLTISHCAARRKYGQPVPCHPSRFLKDLPQELVESGDARTSQPVAVEAGKDIFAAIRASIG